MKTALPGLAAAALLLLSGPAHAQDPAGAPDDAARAKARALGYAGVEAYEAGDYAAASAKLEESYQLLPVPSLGLWSARALVERGRWVEAEERYRAVTASSVAANDSPVQQQAKDDAQRERGELLRRIPSLKIRIAGAEPSEVTVSVDGAVRAEAELVTALLVNPGRHEISGVRGTERSQVVLDIVERTHEEVELRFSALPPSEPSPGPAVVVPPALPPALPPASPAPPAADSSSDLRRAVRIGGWVAVGAGAAGLTTSLVSYVLANQQYDSFERRNLCTMGGCSQDEVDSYNTLRDVQRVSLIAGSVLAAAGVTALVLTWNDAAERPQQLSVELGPASAVIRGSF
jgi:hypothetical protein